MKLSQPPKRRVRVQIVEFQNNRTVPGSVHSISVWDATSEQVAAVIRRALEAEIQPDATGER